ncbi:MAG TPA: multicopper oxidase domain-containing protein [Gemmatimonadales bacterium]|nr:multicopper oxidase domain-containing protein [Gemmatimonadales bacterium]
MTPSFRAALPGLLLLTLASAPAGGPPSTVVAARTRTYFIAADPVAWDYVPGGRDEIVGAAYVDTAFFGGGPPRPMSTVYQKLLYREYTDSTFKTLKPRPPEWAHLGFLGPLIRGVVGDTIRVVFRNNGDRPYSVHPHGVLYDKSSEGVPYNDGTSGADKADDGVPPGSTHVYVWQVPERAGPGPMEGSSVMWMYHSHVDEVRDINTGLFGPMIITARDKARPDGSPNDVDREIVASFMQVEELDSWLKNANFGPSPDSLLKLGPKTNPSLPQDIYPWFVKFTINGFVHGSMPLADLTVRKGQHVRWYLMASTNDFDFHSPHWHGNTVVINGMRTDVTALLPMQMVTADMVPDDVGTWLFHCHVSFHNEEGMAVRYRVER